MKLIPGKLYKTIKKTTVAPKDYKETTRRSYVIKRDSIIMFIEEQSTISKMKHVCDFERVFLFENELVVFNEAIIDKHPAEYMEEIQTS